MCLPNFMKLHHCFFKILKNQSVTDRWTDMKTVYPQANCVCRVAGGGGTIRGRERTALEIIS